MDEYNEVRRRTIENAALLWIFANLSHKELGGSAKDDLMDKGKLLLLRPVHVSVCAWWIQYDAMKLGKLCGVTFPAKCKIPYMLIRSALVLVI